MKEKYSSMPFSCILPLMALLLIITAYPRQALAGGWSTDPSINTPVSTANGSQYNPVIVSDGTGGAIITWVDERNDSNLDIYAQRINASGIPQWTVNGVAICTANDSQYDPVLISDGSGGAIITWIDSRNDSNGDIYAQRINASGIPQWNIDGVAICTASKYQEDQVLISDGSGGAIIAWYDFRSSRRIYAQRINASGVPQWTLDGVAVCPAGTDAQLDPQIICDESGGAIITWVDWRNSMSGDIYAQRINASGTLQWTTSGIAICTNSESQRDPEITTDGSGGAIITWDDNRNGFYDSNIYAQRINAYGTPQWTVDGVAVCTASYHQSFPEITTDGSGGAIIAWRDWRKDQDNNDIYVQRINASGSLQWTVDGVAVCTESDAAEITSDGSGGAIITWRDFTNGGGIYAQHINASGSLQWTNDGVAVSTESNYAEITTDGSGGAIMTWSDLRSGSEDIYAQQISKGGALGVMLDDLSDDFPWELFYPAFMKVKRDSR